MLEIPPEQLHRLLSSLPTGTLLFCHKPFKWHSVDAWLCRFMRWVLRSKRYHHGAIIRWDCGMPFVIEATFFQRSRPKKLVNWIADREGYLIGVKPQQIEESRIVKELDKPYDNAAAISLIFYRVFGKWNGHTGSFAEDKNYCWELMARAMGFEKPWMAGIADFE